MRVVSNTSPICYLILIGEIGLLHELYGQVEIPEFVASEFAKSETPESVRAWIANPPEWLCRHHDPPRPALFPSGIHLGEWLAVSLSEELKASLLIMDDLSGRDFAEERGINTVGTIGVLLAAGDRGLTDARGAVQKLFATTFFISEELQAMLERRLGCTFIRSP